MGIKTLLPILWIMLLLVSTEVMAQTYYVGDTLRVGIRPEPVNGGPSIAVVSSGTPLQILERNGRHVKVRSPSGVEGWVKSAYITNDKPAQVLLDEASAKVKNLQNEIARLRNNKKGSDSSASSADIKQLELEKDALQSEVTRLRQQVNGGNGGQLFGNQSFLEFSTSNFTPLYFLLGGLIFILSLGFLFGVTWHKHQVTKRLGGLSL